jgi:hypothetical protein
VERRLVLLYRSYTELTREIQDFGGKMLFLKSLAVWLVFIMVESLNGTIRILWLVPSVGDLWAHRISFVTGVAIVLAIATLSIQWLHASRISQFLGIGVLWMLLTFAFEMALGRFVFNYSWAQIAADYNLNQGGFTILGLVWLMLSPWLAAKIRGVLPAQNRLA